jgi:hypothetical protein
VRIKSLEKRATDIEAAIEEMADDTAKELRVIWLRIDFLRTSTAVRHISIISILGRKK